MHTVYMLLKNFAFKFAPGAYLTDFEYYSRLSMLYEYMSSCFWSIIQGQNLSEARSSQSIVLLVGYLTIWACNVAKNQIRVVLVNYPHQVTDYLLVDYIC